MNNILTVDEYLTKNLGITDRDFLEAVKSAASVKNVKKNERLMSNGEKIKTVYFLLYGVVKFSTITADGDETVSKICYERTGPLLSSSFNSYTNKAATEDVTAKTNCILMSIGIDDFCRLTEAGESGRRFAATIFHNLSLYNTTYLNILKRNHNDLKQLYLYFLKEKPMIIANSTLEEFASFIGFSYYQVSRVRTQLKKENPEALEGVAAYKLGTKPVIK